jgi:hypothetical protein
MMNAGAEVRGISAPAIENLQVEELTSPQIDALDRQRKLFMLPASDAPTSTVMHSSQTSPRRKLEALPPLAECHVTL